MQESDLHSVCTRARLFVDQPDALFIELMQPLLKIGNGVGHVVQAFAPLLEKRRDGRFRRSRLQQFQPNGRVFGPTFWLGTSSIPSNRAASVFS